MTVKRNQNFVIFLIKIQRTINVSIKKFLINLILNSFTLTQIQYKFFFSVKAKRFRLMHAGKLSNTYTRLTFATFITKVNG